MIAAAYKCHHDKNSDGNAAINNFIKAPQITVRVITVVSVAEEPTILVATLAAVDFQNALSALGATTRLRGDGNQREGKSSTELVWRQLVGRAVTVSSQSAFPATES